MDFHPMNPSLVHATNVLRGLGLIEKASTLLSQPFVDTPAGYVAQIDANSSGGEAGLELDDFAGNQIDGQTAFAAQLHVAKALVAELDVAGMDISTADFADSGENGLHVDLKRAQRKLERLLEADSMMRQVATMRQVSSGWLNVLQVGQQLVLQRCAALGN